MIDLLVSVDESAPALTLIETKRRIGDHGDLQRATIQALAYAVALGLPSFVIADATQLWIYQVRDGQALLVQEFAGDVRERDERRVRDLLLALAGS